MIVALDANIVIYLIEANPIWTPIAIARLTSLRAAQCEIACCDATRLECLVKPYSTGNVADISTYQLFFNSPQVKMLSVTGTKWERAVQIAAVYKLKPLDSIHLAAAIKSGCGLFLTNDSQLARCTAIPVEVLT